MIEYHKNNEIDRVQWDSCIKNIPAVKPYAYSWYLDIMAPGWDALVDDDYDSVFPIPGYRRFGFQFAVTPSYIQQLGAFAPDKPASYAVNEFLEFMPDIYTHVDLCIGQKVKADGYKVTEMLNYELDLSKPYEKLWANFSPQCRKNIEASAKKKFEIVTNITPDEIVDAIILDNLKKINRIKLLDNYRLKVLMNFCLKNKKGRLMGVRTARKKLIFGLFLIETHGNRTIGFILNTPESNKKRIGYFVISELIKAHSSTRTVLDFAGSSIPGDESLADSFGCQHAPYYRICRNRLFLPFRRMKF